MDQLSAEQTRLLLLKELNKRQKQHFISSLYPETGPLSRDNYPRHMEFFRAGSKYRQRLMMAANRIGKTLGVGGYEMTLHLTGLYPDWWEGRRFNRPIKAWAAGDTSKTVRDIIQNKLVGPPGETGTALIPAELIEKTTSKSGIPDALEDVYVHHVSGGLSILGLKSYDQRRESFQGTERDVIWLDEEPPEDIYAECLTRTMTTKGIVMCTFTPLLGLSDVVKSFLPSGRMSKPEDVAEGKFVCMATWEDAPHLSDEDKEELLKAYPPYQRDARARGIPALGAGAIYPIAESDITCDIFAVPDAWPRCYGFDVGWNRTAAIWGAIDPQTDTVYLYDEYYRSQAEPAVHANAIRARGHWIPGVVDPAARGRSQADGYRLLELYTEMDLDIAKADNAVESGIQAVWQRLSAGRLRIFKHLENWLSEFRVYRRDEKGNVVKQSDHLMDATRYLMMSGIHRAITKPDERDDWEYEQSGRSEISGY